jgi:hypothetical protein
MTSEEPALAKRLGASYVQNSHSVNRGPQRFPDRLRFQHFRHLAFPVRCFRRANQKVAETRYSDYANERVRPCDAHARIRLVGSNENNAFSGCGEFDSIVGDDRRETKPRSRTASPKFLRFQSDQAVDQAALFSQRDSDSR